MVKKDILIVCALEQETVGELEDWDVLYTGVGKVNATLKLTQRLHSSHLHYLPLMPELVINYGTAGSRELPIGELVDCTKFIQRDMDVSPLGFQNYETPWGNRNISFLTTTLNGITCGTGDSFVTNPELPGVDIVDMEAYAIAKVCRDFNIQFRCFKYISDNADENAGDDWNKFEHEKAESLFIEQLAELTSSNSL